MARKFLSFLKSDAGGDPAPDPASAQLSALAARLAAVTQENTDLKAQIATAVDTGVEYLALQAQVETLTGELAAVTARATAAETEKATLEAAMPDMVKAGVIEAIAAQGVPSTEVPESTPQNADKLRITNAQFRAMTPREKSDFSKSGGRIID